MNLFSVTTKRMHAHSEDAAMLVLDMFLPCFSWTRTANVSLRCLYVFVLITGQFCAL